MGIEEREAVHGKKMIEIRVRFWTDQIAKEGKIIPKHCWDSGVVRISSNDLHGITSSNPIPFNSLSEILPKIEKLFKNHGIKLHLGSKSRRYYSELG
jgi:hypothetical protein